MSASEKARNLQVVVLDVDGVLTDGRIGYGAHGGEFKFFDVKDGYGIRLLREAGLRVGILTGRSSEANRTRARELHLDFERQGCSDKRAVWDALMEELAVSSEQCLYMGDDIPDLAVLRAAGVAVTVADAVPAVKEAVDWVTQAPGGRGAVREMAEWVLAARTSMNTETE